MILGVQFYDQGKAWEKIGEVGAIYYATLNGANYYIHSENQPGGPRYVMWENVKMPNGTAMVKLTERTDCACKRGTKS